MKRLYAIAGGIFLFLWVTSKIHNKLEENSSRPFLRERVAEAKEEQPSTVAVRVSQIQKKVFRELIPVQGTVSGTKVQLRFEIPGVIQTLNLQPGTHVKQGDALAALNQEDALLKIQYREAKEAAARSQLVAAENKLKLYEDLFETGYLIEAKLDEIRLEKENKEKELEAVRLEVESARREQEKLFLRAPCDGVIAEKEAAVGEFIPAGTKVATLVDLEDLYLELNVTERYLGKVKPGQAVKFSAHSYSDEEFQGVVESVVPLIEGKSRTIAAKVKLKQTIPRFIPGMFVKGWINVYEKPDALTLPASVLQKQGGETFVMIVTPEKKIERRSVKLGYLNHDEVEVKKGLRAGEWFVVDSPRPLEEGEPVRVVYEAG